MEKTYSRKQIEEAIRYWTRELNVRVLTEALTKTVTEFENAFSHDIVFSADSVFAFSLENAKIIFSILNKNVFSNELKQIPFEFVSFNEMRMIASKFGYKNAYAMYWRLFENYKLNDGTYIGKVLKSSQKFVMAVDIKQTFAFAVSCLCHEMIHYWLDEKTTIVNAIAEAKFEHKILNTHNNEFFEKYMDIAANEGINVMKDTDGKTFSELNDISHKVILKTDDTRKLNEADAAKIVDRKTLDDAACWINDNTDLAAERIGNTVALMSFS